MHLRIFTQSLTHDIAHGRVEMHRPDNLECRMAPGQLLQ